MGFFARLFGIKPKIGQQVKFEKLGNHYKGTLSEISNGLALVVNCELRVRRFARRGAREWFAYEKGYGNIWIDYNWLN